MSRHSPKKVTAALLLSALGIVFGDIGTSPLYAIRESFKYVPPEAGEVLGILSLIFWSMTAVISLKYLLFVMRADNKGEGGTLSLMAGVLNHLRSQSGRVSQIVLILGILGASFLYGESVLTPAISVLSAMEGLKFISPKGESLILPLTIIVLVILFTLQARGTGRVGRLFGPILLIWFSVLLIFGLKSIVKTPIVLEAFNPLHAFNFLAAHRNESLVTLGAVFLTLTGGEALFADMGHFGLKPIRRVWFCFVWPALLINYFGQGALILRSPEAAENPFFLLFPNHLLPAIVLLATLATVTASQAVISGSFSLTKQAVQLGILPRLKVVHTSSKHIGQVYVPVVNWLLMVGAIILVLEFKSSSALVSAYGIAISSCMVITTVLMALVVRRKWKWAYHVIFPLFALIALVDLPFFAANITKFLDGGWVTVVIALFCFSSMMTWRSVRQYMGYKLTESLPPLEEFVREVPKKVPLTVPGTAIYMSGFYTMAPPALLHNLKHNKVIHEQVVIVSIVFEEEPFIPVEQRVQVERLAANIYRVMVRYGFMDRINLPRALELCSNWGLEINPDESIFFLGRENIIFTSSAPFSRAEILLFTFLARYPQAAGSYFGIPPDKIVEMGFQLAL